MLQQQLGFCGFVEQAKESNLWVDALGGELAAVGLRVKQVTGGKDTRLNFCIYSALSLCVGCYTESQFVISPT